MHAAYFGAATCNAQWSAFARLTRLCNPLARCCQRSDNHRLTRPVFAALARGALMSLTIHVPDLTLQPRAPDVRSGVEWSAGGGVSEERPYSRCGHVSGVRHGDRRRSAVICAGTRGRRIARHNQIHNWRVPSRALSRASALVTSAYAKIGVRTEWTGVVQQKVGGRRSEPPSETSRIPIAQLTIIILTPKMAARGRFADGVLGVAAVASEGMGRIAYAIYDRVTRTAAMAGINEGDLLGFVMAHEIGHLLLPHGSQPENGLMRGRWEIRDFQRTDVSTLEFSPLQASQESAGRSQTIRRSWPSRGAPNQPGDDGLVFSLRCHGCAGRPDSGGPVDELR